MVFISWAQGEPSVVLVHFVLELQEVFVLATCSFLNLYHEVTDRLYGTY